MPGSGRGRQQGCNFLRTAAKKSVLNFFYLQSDFLFVLLLHWKARCVGRKLAAWQRGGGWRVFTGRRLALACSYWAGRVALKAEGASLRGRMQEMLHSAASAFAPAPLTALAMFTPSRFFFRMQSCGPLAPEFDTGCACSPCAVEDQNQN